MSYRRDAGSIPNRWLYCPQRSVEFIAERFLAFKTPLSENYDSKMPEECQFHPKAIFEYMKEVKGKIGLWIDLTNTNRFYNRQDIEDRGCRYIKLQCRGHGETPSPEQTKSFIEIVDDFINDRPLDVIGVHCTHGFNRTGFLIVSYMVDRMDCSVEAALHAFAKARPPGIYKEDYIKELYRRYDDEDDAPPAPELPEWCFEYDDSDRDVPQQPKKRRLDSPSSSNGQANEEDDSNQGEEKDDSAEGGSANKKKRKRESVKKDAKFMAGVPGVMLVLDQPRLSNLQAKVQDMCEWQGTGFPGSQPVSMDLTNVNFLHTKPYRVSWKADGTRYMMLIDKKDEVYFFDRNFSCFKVENITFPRSDNLNEHLTDTLVDGEMVIDKVNGKSIPRYLVYDIIRFENDHVAKQNFFPNRLHLIKNRIVGARYEAVRRGIINRNLEPFSVRDKEFWEITQAGALLGPKFAKQLCHEPDGLIFQPSIDPYTPGPCPEVLKWKPLSMNSVDFKLRIREESGLGIVPQKIGDLYVGGLEVPFAQIRYSKGLKELNNKIIECKIENGAWSFMRQRTDKTYPNSYSTAVAVCNSIKNPVTTEYLLEFIERHRFYDDSDAMPPPPPQRRFY